MNKAFVFARACSLDTSRIQLTFRLKEGNDGGDLAIDGIGGCDAYLSLTRDELSRQGVTDMAALGGGIAGSGEAMTGRDIGRVMAQGKNGTVAEVDEGVGDA